MFATGNKVLVASDDIRFRIDSSATVAGDNLHVLAGSSTPLVASDIVSRVSGSSAALAVGDKVHLAIDSKRRIGCL